MINHVILIQYIHILLSSIIYLDTGYPHDGRADKDSYPHDGRADKDSYPHDRHNQMHYVKFIIMVIVRIDKLASIYLIEQTSI